MRKILALILTCITVFVFAQKTEAPKQEFRGVWLSTVANIDWPVDKRDSEAKKQADLVTYMDTLKANGVNAVLFQVRPACDAMYKSEIEPWSYWFSGTQGQGPTADSLWDPLDFAIREAHKRGMELHAWVNPYRAVHKPAMMDSSFYMNDEHVAKKHPEWLLKFSSVYILDPGKAEVRDYIYNVFMDIVTRYDIDGLHMDDYFYPYQKITNEDSLTFVNENRGFKDIDDWRRDNINILVKRVSDSIDKIKPWVKWGISPFGIYRPGIPEGIKGFDAWAVLYCDPIAWLKAGTVDYITPQCYWPHGGGQDYAKLIPYWSKEAKKANRHFYPGQAMFHAGSEKFSRGEIPRQIRLNRDTDGCQGSVYFTANNFFANPKNTMDSLQLDLYKNKALWPTYKHQKGKKVKTPGSFAERKYANEVLISWEENSEAWGYVIYRSKSPKLINENTSILEVVPGNKDMYVDNTDEQWFYAMTSLNHYKEEGKIKFASNDFVTPLKPAYQTSAKGLLVPFAWQSYPQAENYHIQVALDKDFDDIIYEEKLLTRKQMNKRLPRNMNFYWRVKANNAENWSPVWTFSR